MDQLFVIAIVVIICLYINKVCEYINLTEDKFYEIEDNLLNYMDTTNKLSDIILGNDLFIIDINKSLEKNIIDRNKYYSKEVLNMYDDDTKSIIEKYIINDENFKILYNAKLEIKNKFPDLNEKEYDIFNKI